MRSILFIICCLLILPLSVYGDDDDDDVEKKSICRSHDDCYKIFSLNTYCCKDSCCNWFKFFIFYYQQETKEIPYKGPSLIIVALLAIISLVLLIIICCLCCLGCLCKQCGCCKQKKKTRRNRPNYTHTNFHVISGRTNINQSNRAYMPITQTVPPNITSINTNQINRTTTTTTTPATTTSHVQPSAPYEEPLLSDINLIEPTVPHDLDYDKPPAYDDLVRTGEVNETIINAQRKKY